MVMKLDATIQATFGENVKALRCSKQFTAEELNKELAFAPKRISEFENCRLKPSLEEVIKISEYFNVNIDLLLYQTCTLKIEWQ
jgi:transcriptional regulator with XRE-family HTH domain